MAGDANLDQVTKYFCRKINEEQRSDICLLSVLVDCCSSLGSLLISK